VSGSELLHRYVETELVDKFRFYFVQEIN